VAGIAGITGGAAAVNELDVPESNSNNELQPTESNQDVTEVEPVEQDRVELDVDTTTQDVQEIEPPGEQSQAFNGTLQTDVGVGQQQNDDSLISPESPSIEPDEVQTPDVGSGEQTGERSFPTGESAVVGSDTGSGQATDTTITESNQGLSDGLGTGTGGLSGSGPAGLPGVGNDASAGAGTGGEGLPGVGAGVGPGLGDGSLPDTAADVVSGVSPGLQSRQGTQPGNSATEANAPGNASAQSLGFSNTFSDGFQFRPRRPRRLPTPGFDTNEDSDEEDGLAPLSEQFDSEIAGAEDIFGLQQ
jgi:hypothetical protein